jgi:hypothetical protein
VKTILALVCCVVFLLGLTMWGQDAVGAPGCGPGGAQFAVKTGDARPDQQGAASRAVVYFIEDDAEFASIPKPTTRMGIDGRWVGATHGNSYLFVTVDPGEHHLCASWQKNVVLGGGGRQGAAAHFTAEAGGVYYFEAKNRWWRDVGRAEMSLKPLDNDEGQLLVGKYAYSSSQAKE